MLPTIDRYLMKEVILVFVATLLVLLAMVLSHRLGGYLNQAASGLLSRSAIFVLIGLQAIRYLVVLIPLASLLAIMLALGRMYRDSEMVAIFACGFGPLAIYRPLLFLAVPMAAVLAVLSFYVVPLCMELQYELQERARQDAEISIINAGTFRQLGKGQYVVYVGNLAEGGKELQKIFIKSPAQTGIAITTAERGHLQIDPSSGVRYIVLNDGRRYEGMPGRGDYQSVRFARLTVRVDTAAQEDMRIRRQAIPTPELLATDTPLARSELHERIGGPVSLLLIAFIAPLIAHASPREGRYARVVAAILVYTIYINLLGVGQAWLEQDLIWSFLGLWWVHALLVLLGIGLWAYRYGLTSHSGGRSHSSERSLSEA